MKGIAASSGISIGKVLIKKEQEIRIDDSPAVNIDQEIQKLNAAKEKARTQIEGLYNRALNNIGKSEAQIFQAHLMMLDDPEFFGQVEETIKNDGVNAAYALKTVTDNFISIFQTMENEYMKERAADVRDVSGRVTRILLGVEITDFSLIDDEVIIAARDLTPSDTAQMDKKKILGFITDLGGRTAHSAIMARTLEIPAVVGLKDVTAHLKDGDIVVMDGDTGEVIINPSKEVISQYRTRKQAADELKKKLYGLKGQKSITKDGVKVELAANIGTPDDMDAVLRNDAEAIGLYRTEFLYMDRDRLPSEEEQFEAYKVVAEKMQGKPVVIRTLDIGGDKELSYLKFGDEMNPFLGYRAIRLCLDRQDIFRTQLRALLRASAFGNIRIMFPMISSVEELREAKRIVEDVKNELRGENKKFNDKVQLGMMVEIPSTAVISDMLAKEVDFFSIGTNDLIQYTTAVDRGNQKIAYLYNQFHPALLRLVKMTIENGHKAGIWVGMCGEVAADPKLAPILAGMGLDEFSMSPSSILRTRAIIRNVSTSDMKQHVEKVINIPAASEVEKYIDKNIHIEY